ncbi:sigma-54-dependent transcriptional regulator [Maritalea mediterranea]|uniref:DNA-binding transcriptional regulator NtrC n=1 Tax=Maritalea mediterranea TaxID=2909667 RepID=A0ABS9E9R6_9HYPH|nr:sigma-54 dependent transcriptional regulator [Maritalea mediterranea]MCF4099626.1 sigma-54 dependent transcriptional regulator [Maritalea mediterranea]
MANILVIDDDPIQCRLSEEMLKTHGYEPLIAQSGAEGLDILESQNVQAVILDLVMPEMDGMTVLTKMRERGYAQPVIVQTAHPEIENIISAIRLGATDFFAKPISQERLVISLQNALKRYELENCLRTETHRHKGALSFADMAAKSPAMKKSIAHGEKAAATQIPVLIEGEAGTGRDMMARAIHHHAKRSGKPFIAINCSTMDADALEALLFGAPDQKEKTAFDKAQGGTLYLDEIGALSMELQGRLLALFTGKKLSTSPNDTAPLDVRLICATSKRLLNLTKQKQFREDLYYRLNIFPIYMPPLRDRADDIAELVSHFITKFSVAEGRRIEGCTPQTMELLRQYEWPGNVRQLENAIYRAILLAEDGILTPNEFPQIQTSLAGAEQLRAALKSMSPQAAPSHIDAAPQVTPLKSKTKPIKDRFLTEEGRINNLAQVEKELIEFALKKHNGKMSAVARTLGIGRSTLYRKLKEYGLEDAQSSAA